MATRAATRGWYEHGASPMVARLTRIILGNDYLIAIMRSGICDHSTGPLPTLAISLNCDPDRRSARVLSWQPKDCRWLCRHRPITGTTMAKLEPQQVTQMLGALVAGDDSAASRLLPLVYEELRSLAGNMMRGERPDHTLQPTALVHEAYVRLVGAGQTDWQGRIHFLAVASRAMRRLLINHARDRHAAKRGGGDWARITLDEVVANAEERVVDVLALDEALERLAVISQRQARLVELRFFGGLSIQEAADALDLSPTTAKADWIIARAWLARELGSGPSP